MILNLESEKLLPSGDRACGKIPILMVMSLARRHGWQPVLLHYSNSGDTGGGRRQVVGYAAVAFFGPPLKGNSIDSFQQLSPEQGQTLVRLARRTISRELGRNEAGAESDALSAALNDPCFQEKQGTFVTLKLHGQLRGCIGSVIPVESILAGVRRNALRAAFQDHRFIPLSAKELDHVAIEVSVLTEPKPLIYRNGSDLLAKLRPDIDGVIVRKGTAGATYLPQVWQQLPHHEMFLSSLCLKAGLSADAWQKNDLEVLTYQVQYFEEEQ